MINYRFLNYKRYSTFLSNLDQISNDSVVFIQDKCCIWARGQLYKCGGAGSGSIADNSLIFKDSDNNVQFTIIQDGDTLILRDSNGNESRVRYALQSDITALNNQIQSINNRIDHSDSAVVDNLSDLNDVINDLRASKQDKLVAGSGIELQPLGDVVQISSTIDSEVYVIVQELPSTQTANPNKIYILETANGDGTYRYVQYRLRDGQWASFDTVTPTINLSGYLKSSDAANTYQIKGSYLTAIDLIPYVKTSDLSELTNNLNNYITLEFAENTYQKTGDYITKEYALNTFVKQIDVYTPDTGESVSGDPSSITPSGGNSNIIVDYKLDTTSSNPVQNRVIALALENKVNRADLYNYATISQLGEKADVTTLTNYAQKEYVNDAVYTKQDRLTAGRGIQIVDNIISTNLDTDVFIITSQLPSVNISENKIYLLEVVDPQTGNYSYVEYRYENGSWRQIGAREVTVNLTDYVTKNLADSLYQPIGTYLTTDVASQTYQPIGDYATNSSLAALQTASENSYQPKGDYALAQDVSDAIATLEQTVSRLYVQKTDVYTPNSGDSTSGDPSGDDQPVNPQPSGSTIVVDSRINEQSTNPVENRVIARALQNKVDNSTLNEYTRRDYIDSHFVTISSAGYDALVQSGQIQYDAIYFVYEGEESTTWGFGDRFPIILTEGNTPNSIGTFPITLMDGSTPNSIGTFPINLA